MDSLQLIFTNDLHAAFSKHLLALIEDLKRQKSSVLLDCGDFIDGTILSHYKEGTFILDLMKEMGYVAFVPGNHEFTCGLEGFLEFTKEASARNLSVLCANLSLEEEVEKDTFWRDAYEELKRHISSHLLYEINGLRLGLLGLMGEEVFIPEAWPVRFKTNLSTVNQLIEHMRLQGAEVVVVLFHGSVREARKLWGEIKGADLMLCGHSHVVFLENMGGKLMMEAGSDGRWVGLVEIDLCGSESSGKYSLKAKLIDVNHIYPECYFLKVNAEHLFPIDENSLFSYFPELGGKKLSAQIVTFEHSPIIESAYLVADAIRDSAKTDVGITTLAERGYFTSKEVTVSDLFKVGRAGVPCEGVKGDVLCKYYLTLSEIKVVLEATVCMYKELGLDVFLVLSGLEVIFDTGRSPLDRIVQITLNGRTVYQEREWQKDRETLISVSTSLLLLYGLRRISSELTRIGVVDHMIFPRNEDGIPVEWRSLRELQPLLYRDERGRYVTLWKAVLEYLSKGEDVVRSEKRPRLKDLGERIAL